MKKLQFKLFTLLTVGAVFICGCQNKNVDLSQITVEQKPIYDWGNVSGKTITVWGDKDDLARPYITRAFENYKKQTGNTVKTVALLKEDIDKKLPQVFASASLERPDILLSYGGTNIDNLNPDENFYDFTHAPWVDDLTDTAINQSIYNGKVIGLPHSEASISGTLYNKEIFKKLNIEIPKTQSEFMAVCEKLLDNGITPMYLPYSEITMLLYQFPMDSILADTTILDGLNNGTISYSDIPEMKKIVEWYKTMADKGYFGDNYAKNNWDGMDKAMQGKEYAMMLCWDTWLYTNFTGDPSSIGLMPAFMGTPENGTFEGANVSLCIVNKKSDNLDASLDLISFMADPCNYNVSFDEVYTARVFNNQTGSIATPQYMEVERLVEKLFYDSTAWSRIEGFSQLDAKYIQDYMMGKSTLNECLQAMDTARLNRAGMSK